MGIIVFCSVLYKVIRFSILLQTECIMMCNPANFGIDLISSKCRASIADTNTNNDIYIYKSSLCGGEQCVMTMS